MLSEKYPFTKIKFLSVLVFAILMVGMLSSCENDDGEDPGFVHIVDPQSGKTFKEGDNITFEAIASGSGIDQNDDGDDIEGATIKMLIWESDKDGELRREVYDDPKRKVTDTFSTNKLSADIHVISCTAFDEDIGPDGKHQIRILIQDNWADDDQDNETTGNDDSDVEEDDEIVNFSDPNLEAIISNNLKKTSGEAIYRNELEGIKSLDASNSEIANLGGIEYCVNLTSLNLNNNFIEDVSQLEGLTNLTILRLDLNQIEDIEPLKGLTGLGTLHIENNNVSTMEALKGLTILRILKMNDNLLITIPDLSQLTSLIDLHIENNKLNDISGLKGLTSVELLFLENNEIKDMSTLSSLTEIKTLDLEHNQIDDISALVANGGLGEDDWVCMAENDLDTNCDPANGDTTDCDNVKALNSRGVYVGGFYSDGCY